MATTGIRVNSLVIYRGSFRDFHGILFRVTRVEDYFGDTRYTLAYRGEDDTVLLHVRPKSIRRVVAKDILWRTCQKCDANYWYERRWARPCPCCDTGAHYWRTTVLGVEIERAAEGWQRVNTPDGLHLGSVQETPNGWVHVGPQVSPRPTARPCKSRRTAVRRLLRECAAAGSITLNEGAVRV
ncbi:hypothetical protein GCM10023196_036320 [Actinoallomurus vinaceus]|uniref:DUF35 domain-containing protein n=1 Tax=Actinoallomurus vinaceus TaxID=1080074 RepID=A0ABP8UCS5_9ACTN